MSEVVQVAFTVTANGSTDATDKAKQKAREDGWIVRTVARVEPLTIPPVGLVEWRVTLAAVER